MFAERIRVSVKLDTFSLADPPPLFVVNKKLVSGNLRNDGDN